MNKSLTLHLFSRNNQLGFGTKEVSFATDQVRSRLAAMLVTEVNRLGDCVDNSSSRTCQKVSWNFMQKCFPLSNLFLITTSKIWHVS